ncbi:MAG TPA: hopanoid-associated sugar epimerase [Xanthobacteraceae bacterium]|jgi:dihydroflavonol-4-reductase
MSNGRKVLLTGATGFIGSALARVLCPAGFAVRTIVRRTSPRHHLAGLEMEFYDGDICDRSSVRTALAGVQYVFHVAADYRLWARRPSEILKTNVGGTRIVMEEALRARVERIVHTSSVATLALHPHGDAADESAQLSEDEATGAYKRSKVAAERLVEQLVANEGLPAVIVHPSTPVGPRDVRPTPTGRIIVEAANGRIPAFVDTGLNLVHVDDVAAGHLAALQHGRIGERYILGGENVPFGKMLGDISRLAGRRPPRLRIPHAMAVPVAYVAEGLALLSGKEPLATVDGMRMAKHHMYFTARKAERELGFTARPYMLGLEHAIRWFREAGYVRM